jgi:hypothetical protein
MPRLFNTFYPARDTLARQKRCVLLAVRDDREFGNRYAENSIASQIFMPNTLI